MNCLRSRLEEYAVGRSVDELAPSLSSLVHALLKGKAADYADPQLFIELTYPTDSMRAVLSAAFGAMRAKRGRVAAMLLDADMGSGKTHLLALMLHLLYSLRKWPHFRREAERLLGEDAAALDQPTAVLAVDLKTGSAAETLELFEESLGMAGDRAAADLIREAKHDPAQIDAVGLAKLINARTNLAVLVDELFGFALMNCDNPNHEMARLLKLIYELVQRRRPLADSGESAVVLLAASARSDQGRWRQVSRGCGIGVFVDQFERDLERIKMSAGSRWVSPKEAVRIAAKRLGLSPNDFSRGLYDLAEKVLREDALFPGAHHLRGLIKALAAYALAACEAGHERATAAHLTEAAISALLGADAHRYRSLYDVIKARVGADGDLLYAVNAVFTGSMVGDVERLAAVVTGDRGVVTSTERWLMDELLQVMPSQRAVQAVRKLEAVPHIKAIKGEGEAVYAVTPFLNVRAYLMEAFSRTANAKAVDARQRLREILYAQTPQWGNVVVADGPEAFDPKELRDGALNLVVVLSGDPKRVFERVGRSSLAVAAVAPNYDVLMPALTKEEAFIDAVEEAKRYLEARESGRASRAAPDRKIYERIVESLQRELVEAAAELGSKVFNELMMAVADSLAYAYYRSPATGELKPVRVDSTEFVRAGSESGKKENKDLRYEKLVEAMHAEAVEAVRNAVDAYLEALAQTVDFVYEGKRASSLGHKFEPGSKAELPKSTYVAKVGEQYFTFSREAYQAFLEAVRESAVRRGYAVQERGDLVIIERIERPRPSPPPPTAAAPATPPQPLPDFQRLPDLDAVLRTIVEGAEVELVFEVSDPSVVIALLNANRERVKRVTVRTDGLTYTYSGG